VHGELTDPRESRASTIMNRVTNTLFGLAAASLACDPVSRNVGDLQTADGMPIDPVTMAHLVCDTEASCCGNQTLESQDNISLAGDCYDEMEWSFRHEAELHAEYGLQADPSCFARLGECGTPLSEKALECQAPCKLYFGTKTVGETCGIDGLKIVDDCAQGLECKEFVLSSEPCGPGNFSTCEETELRCVDPCEGEGAGTICDHYDDDWQCAFDHYCDAPYGGDGHAQGTCVPRAETGAACDDEHDSCVAESFCDPAAPGGPTCVPTLVEGQVCAGHRECASRRCGVHEDPDEQGGVCQPVLTDYCAGGWEAVVHR
jgi:hypothetical protein